MEVVTIMKLVESVNQKVVNLDKMLELQLSVKTVSTALVELMIRHNNNKTIYFFLDCYCNPQGSKEYYCDADGKCPNCKDHISGDLCDRCDTGYVDFPDCTPREYVAADDRLES